MSPVPPRPTAWRTDETPDDVTWRELTLEPAKQAACTVDLYFREAWEDLVETGPEDPAAVLRRHALLIFKPDGVVSGRVGPTLDFAAEHGFELRAALPLHMNRHSMRELWRYDWDVYPVDRLQLANYMYRTTGTVAVVLAHPDSAVVPATVRLSDLKGSSNPASRGPQHLRSVLRAPNSVLNFVHVADEPADIVREVGIFFERAQRRDLWRLLRGEPGPEERAQARAVVDAVVAAAPSHDLDPAASLDRLVAAGLLTDVSEERIRDVMGTARSLRWDAFCQVVDPDDPAVSTWDLIAVATEVLGLERPGARALLPTADGAVWRSRATAGA